VTSELSYIYRRLSWFESTFDSELTAHKVGNGIIEGCPHQQRIKRHEQWPTIVDFIEADTRFVGMPEQGRTRATTANTVGLTVAASRTVLPKKTVVPESCALDNCR
jgi:hypothetical protein